MSTCSACGTELHRDSDTGALHGAGDRLHRHPRPWRAVSDEPVCEHGHPEVEPWSDSWDRECRYGHPITTGVATCTCPGSGREAQR
jgi:hypothetical protein